MKEKGWIDIQPFFIWFLAHALLGREGDLPQLFGIAEIAGATGMLLVADQSRQTDEWNRNTVQLGIVSSGPGFVESNSRNRRQ